MHESFLRHRRFRYLKAALGLCLVSIVLYLWHDPLDGPNGGTWLGYTLGTIGAGLIAWLAWLGVRKRRYATGIGTVKGWVSAHVYLGVALLLVVTLHTGFQFGLNLHTLAYVLMVLVIASGVWGVAAYTRYPRIITDHRSQASRDAWIDEVLELNERAIQLADRIGPDVHRFVLRSAEKVRVGGGWREQLLGGQSDGSPELAALAEILRKKLAASGAERAAMADAEQVILLTEEKIVTSERDPAVERLKQLLELLTRRNDLTARANQDVQMHARMQIWLYLHVPLTAALLAALTAHIVAVFLYR
ncbi:MAG: hypothetical protein ACT4PK_01500 [Gammaproteobacteria bacterium]